MSLLRTGARTVAGTLPTLALVLAACGGGEKPAQVAEVVVKITITPTADARADAVTYLKQLCPKPIGGELNFMVWEGYTDTLFTKPFEDVCGVKVNATYMATSDELVAKMRAGGAQTIDLISPSSDAVTAIIDAGLAQPLNLKRIPTYYDLMASLPRAAGGPQGLDGLRSALGVRPQPADLRHHEDQAGPGQLEGPLEPEVQGQALAPGRHRHALHGGPVSRHG